MLQSINKLPALSLSMLCGLAIASTGGLFATGSAYGQPSECGCLVAAGTTGVVQSVHGNVFVSQASGSVPAQSSMQLQADNSVLVGPQSSSIVRFGGNCTLRLPANSVFEVRPQGDQLCLAVNEHAAAQAGAPAATGQGASFVTPETIFGGIVAGGAAIAIIDDDNPVSK